ncbi:hypothetical protein TNCV_2760181 [Trichonephila clavipes]|nr:hypothetical protein TNCV_2760181 [Trichonephila clavipes]
MFRVGKTRSLPGHSCIGSISTKSTLSWHASTHHGVQQGRQCADHLAKTRHCTYLEYTQCYSIKARIQWVNPTHYPLSAALTLQQCLSGDTKERYHQPIDRSRLTPATHLQQSTIFFLTGRSTLQTCGLGNQRC